MRLVLSAQSYMSVLRLSSGDVCGPICVTSSGGCHWARPSGLGVLCVHLVVVGGMDRVASHPRLPGRTRSSRSLGASQPRLAAGPGSPAVLGLAGVGAAASMTPARSGPACPVHLDKLRLTGA